MGVHTHLITATKALPLLLRGERGLLVEMTDGTHEHNVAYREGVGFYYDLVKANVERILIGLTAELRDTSVTVVAVTPGWLRSEAMLDHFGVTEETWREACARVDGFGISETPTYVARGIAALAADPELSRHAGQVLTAHQLADHLRRHRHRRKQTRLLGLPGGRQSGGRRRLPLSRPASSTQARC